MADLQGNATPVEGTADHDDAVSSASYPVLMAAEAQNVGATPTAVADADVTRVLATRYGQLFTLGGHMNVTRREYFANTAQTNDPVIDSIATGNRIVITQISVTADNGNTADVDVRIGFGTASVPAKPASGASVDGVVISNDGIPKGGGISQGDGGGIIAIGGDGEELRITTGVAQAVNVFVTFFTYAA